MCGRRRGTTRTIAVESEDPELVTADRASSSASARVATSICRAGSRRCTRSALGGTPSSTSARTRSSSISASDAPTASGGRSSTGPSSRGSARASSRPAALDPEAIERTVDAIAGMARGGEAARGEAIAAVGTAGLRIASNSAAFVDAVRARSGIDVEVISGEEEARLAYLAAISGLGLGRGSLVVFDTGGGSSQFTFGDGTSSRRALQRQRRRRAVHRAVRARRRRFRRGSLAAALEAIAADLAQLDGRLDARRARRRWAVPSRTSPR